MDDIHQDNERTVVENYMKQHCIEDLLDETVNCILENRPTNPYCELARLIESKSMPEILEVSATSGFGEKGHCAVNAIVLTNMGVFHGTCGLPRKTFEEGADILQDFGTVTAKVDDLLKGLDPRNLREIDAKLSLISNLDPSVCIAVSIACCRAGAKHRGIPLYRYLCDYALDSSDQLRIPVPVVTSVIRSFDGRVGSSGDLLVQDVNVIPTNSYTYDGAIESLRNAMYMIRSHVRKTETSIQLASCTDGCVRGAGLTIKSEELEDSVRVVHTALQSLESNTNGFKLCLDVRGNGFRYNIPGPNDGKPAVPGTARAQTARSEAAESNTEEENTVYYLLGNPNNIQPVVVSPRTAAAKAKAGEPEVPKGPDLPVGTKTSSELLELYVLLWKQYGLLSIEDPFCNADIEGIKAFNHKIAALVTDYSRGDCPVPLVDAVHDGLGEDVGCHLQIIADDSISNMDQLQEQETDPLFNTLKISLYKIGSVYQALLMCKHAKTRMNWGIIVGCEDEHCIETNDTFIADFAVGVGAGQFTCGGFESGEYICKYSRILDITREDGSISYCGKKFR